MLEKIQGYKTYLAYAGIVVWTLVYLKVPGAKEAIGSENFGLLLAALFTAAGIAQRAATARTHDSLEDLHEKIPAAEEPKADAPKNGTGLAKLVFLASLLTFGLGACTSAPADVDHGVSNASYRKALTRCDTNVAGIVSKLLLVKSDDLAATKPRHSAEWWDDQIGLAQETVRLVEATLKGADQ